MIINETLAKGLKNRFFSEMDEEVIKKLNQLIKVGYKYKQNTNGWEKFSKYLKQSFNRCAMTFYDGGSIDIDVIAKMKKLVPLAKVYAWKNKVDEFEGGRVHAKVAVADNSSCFITSANLTGYAMEKNMELGLLIEGGEVPGLIMNHLQALITTKILSIV